MSGSDNNPLKARPENKDFNTQGKQDEALSRKVSGSEETCTQIEPWEVNDILQNCCENENQIKLLSEVYHLVYGGPRSMLHSSPLTEIKTPMKNTVLHIAASYGNDDIVDLVVKDAPKLLFSFNENNDSALHVAARAGHITTVKKLLAAYTNYERLEIVEAWTKYKSSADLYNGMIRRQDLLGLVMKENDQGNTMLHEAMICGKSIAGVMIFEAFEPYNIENSLGERESLLESCKEYALNITNNAKRSVLYLAVEAANKEAVELILDKCPNFRKPVGLSPVIASIMKRDEDMLSIILRKKPDWIHLEDKHGRLPLHYAAYEGYFEGVDLLLGKCNCCTIRRDIYGYFPIHLASHEGHVKVVKKLLEYYPDPIEMLDNSRRNILHIAAKNGKHEVVRYILRTPKLQEMTNQKDNKGDTPLHLAARSCHPKTVFYLTWDDRVDLGVVNQKNETVMDIFHALPDDSSSFRQVVTGLALITAGAERNSSRVRLSLESRSSDSKRNENSPKMKPNKDEVSRQDPLKDRIETLALTLTLITTASVAACLAVPGEADGTAKNLYHPMFHFFIICITLSFFSSVSATVLIFWARIGIELSEFSYQKALPLLGVALISLSLAFSAGIFTVIRKLHWLATTFVVMAAIFVVVVSLLYIALLIPISTRKNPWRYITYYLFLFLASIAKSSDQGANY